MKTHTYSLLLLMSSSIALFGCGGSSSDSEEASAPLYLIDDYTKAADNGDIQGTWVFVKSGKSTEGSGDSLNIQTLSVREFLIIRTAIGGGLEISECMRGFLPLTVENNQFMLGGDNYTITTNNSLSGTTNSASTLGNILGAYEVSAIKVSEKFDFLGAATYEEAGEKLDLNIIAACVDSTLYEDEDGRAGARIDHTFGVEATENYPTQQRSFSFSTGDVYGAEYSQYSLKNIEQISDGYSSGGVPTSMEYSSNTGTSIKGTLITDSIRVDVDVTLPN